MKEFIKYTEETDCSIPNIIVTIRKYPKRYFVAYEYAEASGGNPLDDDRIYGSEVFIYAKILHSEFDKKNILNNLRRMLE